MRILCIVLIIAVLIGCSSDKKFTDVGKCFSFYYDQLTFAKVLKYEIIGSTYDQVDIKYVWVDKFGTETRIRSAQDFYIAYPTQVDCNLFESGLTRVTLIDLEKRLDLLERDAK